MSQQAPFISFPPGYLGPAPAKFELLANTPDYFALNKNAGLACRQHDWSLGAPDISMALRRELLNAKPQLAALGIEGLYRIYNLDTDCSGVLLYAKREESEERLRNAFGSRQLVFRWHFLAKAELENRAFTCDLPMARDAEDSRMRVSHKSGKKCETRFRYLRSYGAYQLWEAESRDMRLHQVRLHAAESELAIAGERLYAKGDVIYLSQLKRSYREGNREEKPIYDALALHLLSVDFDLPDFAADGVAAPLPRKFSALLKRLEPRGPGTMTFLRTELDDQG